MRQVRMSVFETNSSSTHSVCITRNRHTEVYPEKLYFRCQNFGWEERKLDTPEDKAAYLYAAMLSLYDRDEVEAAKNKIFTILGDVGVDCEFEPAEYYGKSTRWCKSAYVDHACEDDLPRFVESVLKGRGRLLRFLFSGESFVLTGNDNDATNVIIRVGYRHEKYYKGIWWD